MSVSQAGTFNVQEFTDAGIPLALGRLYTYATGTTTQKIAYTDAAGLVPHTYTLDAAEVPYIALNSRGELPAPLYLLTDGPYDLALKRADSSSVWTRRAEAVASASAVALYAGAGGSALVGFLQAGTGAVSRTSQDKMREAQISVKDYGAKGDGTTDDTAAIQRAIVYACSIQSGHMATVYFPAGVYIVADRVLNFPSLVQGARFLGDGYFSSVLRFGTLVASSYMFNNGSTELASFPMFEQLGFEGTTPTLYSAGTIPANAGFIREWSSSGTTQGFKFVNCRVSGFDRVLETEGSATASENKWINCKITHVQNYVLGQNNLQSVNQEFIATDMEVILGHVFYVKSGGGGSIHVFGGSIIPSGTSTKAILKIEGAMSSDGFSMYGSRIELRNASMLVDGSFGVFGVNVLFDGCSIYNTNSTGTKEIVNVRSSQEVIFDGCDFPSNGEVPQYRFSETSNFGQNGAIRWLNSQISDTTSDNILFTSTFGRATARGCRSSRVGAISAEPFFYAMDFDLGSTGSINSAGGADANFEVKRVWMKRPEVIWPKSDGAGGSANDLTIRLPKNCLLKGVFLRKDPGGTTTNTYTLQVTNSDKTTVHATSNTDQQKNAHAITQDNIYTSVGATDNNRNIRVSVTGATLGNQNNSAGFGYLEYI